MTEQPDIGRPLLQLVLDLAEAYRATEAGSTDEPHNDATFRTDLEGVLVDALTRGIHWHTLIVHTARMLARREQARDLREALRDPTKPWTHS